jgi:DNA-binding MarR family transcriptional regulator
MKIILTKRPSVTQMCLNAGHKCATCSERIRESERHKVARYVYPLIVRYFKKHPKATTSDIADVIDLPEYVIIKALERLEKDGLIERIENPVEEERF